MAMKKENPDSKQAETYAKRNKKKKAKFQVDENNDKENLKLVDDFVQEVIEKAKDEYLRQCTNHHGNSDISGQQGLLGDRDGANGGILKEKSEEKDRSRNKRKHNYKYSDPVDEKEISAYEQQEGDKLLEMNPNFGQHRVSGRRPLYDRIVGRFRSLVGCCIGKT